MDFRFGPHERLGVLVVAFDERIDVLLELLDQGERGHIIKLTSYLTNLDEHRAVYREVRASYFPNKAALPTSTLLQISRLANPAYLLEVEVIAILPPRT